MWKRHLVPFSIQHLLSAILSIQGTNLPSISAAPMQQHRPGRSTTLAIEELLHFPSGTIPKSKVQKSTPHPLHNCTSLRSRAALHLPFCPALQAIFPLRLQKHHPSLEQKSKEQPNSPAKPCEENGLPHFTFKMMVLGVSSNE